VPVKFLGYCRRPYKGCSPLRLRRGAALAALLTFAVAGGGCSMSYQLESYFGDNTTTGSISPAPGAKNAEKLPPQHDLAYAKAAASEVLRRGEKDASLDWENPSTGARGTVTPIASAYSQDGQTCRDFLASYVNESEQSWLQGEACQDKGAWQVRSLKPWKRS
jgi:surface antigen